MNEDQLLAQLGVNMGPEDMSEEALLAQINAGIVQEGKDLKKKMDALVTECRALRDAKRIPEAQAKFKEYNAAKKEYEAYIQENPDFKEEIEKEEGKVAPSKGPTAAPVKKTLTTDELIDVYENYHNTEPVKSFKVI